MAQRRALLKAIILGNSGVGKTALMNQYVNRKFSNNYKATIGADFLTKEISVGDRELTLQIWDTAGQERFQSLGVAFYRGADCCVLVYDVTQPDSFTALETWRNEFILQASVSDIAKFPFVVVGNKVDLPDRKVESSKAEAWCNKMGNIPYFECSAKENTDVDEIFTSVALSSLEKESGIDVRNDTDHVARLKNASVNHKRSNCEC